jgi:hypothetical protein
MIHLAFVGSVAFLAWIEKWVTPKNSQEHRAAA